MLEFIGSFGYFGIALLIFVENIFPPIPSEAILLFGGFLTVSAGLNPWLVILSATIGSMLGAAALFYAGRLLGKERIKRFCEGKAGRRLHLSAELIDKAEEKFNKFGFRAVLICRCVPVVRSIISIPAGMAKMKPLPFFLLTLLGSGVWNTVLVFMGAAAGSAWESCLVYFGVYTKIAVGVLALGCVIGFIVVMRKKYKRRGKVSEE